MYGVIFDKKPQDWQILQQKGGYATVHIEGHVILSDDDWALSNDHKALIKVLDEDTDARLLSPITAPVTKENPSFAVDIRIPAGGLYKIESFLRFNGNWEKRGDNIRHLGVGDIYVIAGQSNAVGVGRDPVSDSLDPNIHSFRQNGSWGIAAHPLSDTTDSIFPAYQDDNNLGRSPWISFAKIISKKMGYPIGLIPAAQGGVPLEYWDIRADGRCFKTMLDMLEKSEVTDIKGVLWYQGCNDAVDDQKRNTYLERFCALVKDFEGVFGAGVPIITVQLNKWTSIKGFDEQLIGRQYAEIREAQRRAALQTDNVYITPTIDLPVCDGIHNSGMSVLSLALRVAGIALKYIYGKEAVCDAPDIEKAVLSGEDSVTLYFNNVEELLYCDMNPVGSLIFTVRDDEGISYPIDYTDCMDNRIVVKFDRRIGKGAKISCDRYSTSELIHYDLYSHLPIIPFCDIEIRG